MRRHYLVAVLLVVLATVLTDALPDSVERRNSTLFIGAVMLAGWRGGLWPGVLATVLSSVTLVWFFFPPYHGFMHLGRSDAARMALFVMICALITYLNHARQRAEAGHAALLLKEKLGRARSEAMDWRYRALADAASAVTRARERDAGLLRIAQLATPRFADASAVHVRGDDGAVTTLIGTSRLDGPDPEETFAASRAVETGHPITTPRLIAVPLVAGGQIVGAMSFVTGPERTYRDDDVRFAQDLAHHAATLLASPNRH